MNISNTLGAIGVGLALLSPVLAYAEVQHEQSWEMYQGSPQHTGFIPLNVDAAVISPRWNMDIGVATPPDFGRIPHPAVIGEGLVFVSRHNYGDFDNTLQAFDITTGHEVWKKNFKTIAVQPAAYHNGTVWVQTVNHEYGGTYLRAYQAKDGALVYKQPFETQWQKYKAPTIDGGVVFVSAGYFAGMNAYDEKTGKLKWSVQWSHYGEESTPTLSQKYVLSYHAGVLYKLDKRSGKILAEIQDTISDDGDWWEDVTPVLLDENTAIIANNTYLVKFDLETDQVKFLSYRIASTPSVDKDSIYVIQAGRLKALDKQTGAVQWSAESHIYRKKVSDILVCNNLVFVSDEDGTIAYAKTGEHEPLWETKVGGKMSLSKQGLFIVTEEGELFAFNTH